MKAASDQSSFNPGLIAGLIAIGIIAFIALWALIALGPQLRDGNDGGGHALSKSAPGFAGIVDLFERTGADVDLRRKVEGNNYDGYDPLIILTPTHRTKADELTELLNASGSSPVLIILPKWGAGRMTGTGARPGWVGPGLSFSPSNKLLPTDYFGDVTIRRAANKPLSHPVNFTGHPFTIYLPGKVQTVAGSELEVLIAGPGGGAVLARSRKLNNYILADPDLLNNLAFKSRESAQSAALLLDAIAEHDDAQGLAIDLTLNGFGSQRSLLRFAFVPPFIGITLCLIAAGLLALWQAWVRFGPALRPQRAIPVSKAALIANSADLIKQAGRELDGAAAYVHSLRIAIARRLHAPAGLDTAETDNWIDRHLPAGSSLFSALARRLPLARNTHELLADAQALHQIRKDLLRDS